MTGPGKIYRDFRSQPGRTLTLVLALVVGATAFLSTLGAYGSLTRELTRAYVASSPASATLALSDVSPKLLQLVQARPEISNAARRRTLHARYRVGAEGEWQQALVFIADDFEQMPLAKLGFERGSLAVAADRVLIERSALPLLGGDLGTELTLKLPGGIAQSARITGVVHEPALAPAHTHATLYLYASPELAARLGAGAQMDELRIQVAEGADDRDRIEGTAQDLARWINDSGFAQVHEIRVPPPGRHPHQGQMTTVLGLLLVFAGLVFLMSSLLAASILSALLARQQREIGVLKTLGATSAQLTRSYLLAVGGLSAVAILVSWLPGTLGARMWTLAVAKLLNFDVQSTAPPAGLALAAVSALLIVPVSICFRAIRTATNASVNQALYNFGTSSTAPRPARASSGRPGWTRGMFGVSLSYALRSALRQRERLVLSLALLGISGAVTIAAFSLANSWSGWGVRLRQEQRYDVEIALSDSDRISDVAAAISELPEVAAVETWGHLPTSFITKGKFPVSRTYPDDAHGSFTLLGPAPRSSMLELKLTEGRWLNDSDTDALVINQIVPGYASLHVGATVTLALEGVAKEFHVVGKVEQVGVGATAYAQLTTLNQQLSSNNLPGLLRVRGIPGAQGLSAAIEQALHQSNAKVVATTPLGVYENAMVAHFEILIKSLLALAALTALVGAIGLSSSLLISVLERIREFGVLAAVGANRRQIRSVVLLEGTLVGLVSLGITFTIGPLIALGLGAVIGQMSFALPLPFAPNYAAMATWAGTVLTLSAIASALPALRASNLSVREAMDHV